MPDGRNQPQVPLRLTGSSPYIHLIENNTLAIIMTWHGIYGQTCHAGM